MKCIRKLSRIPKSFQKLEAEEWTNFYDTCVVKFLSLFVRKHACDVKLTHPITSQQPRYEESQKFLWAIKLKCKYQENCVLLLFLSVRSRSSLHIKFYACSYWFTIRFVCCIHLIVITSACLAFHNHKTHSCYIQIRYSLFMQMFLEVAMFLITTTYWVLFPAIF